MRAVSRLCLGHVPAVGVAVEQRQVAGHTARGVLFLGIRTKADPGLSIISRRHSRITMCQTSAQSPDR